VQIFTNTVIQSTLRFAKDFTVVQFLGCGFVVVHSEFALKAAKQLGYKLRTIGGKQVGFSLFTYAV
jgi:hypothetical protein